MVALDPDSPPGSVDAPQRRHLPWETADLVASAVAGFDCIAAGNAAHARQFATNGPARAITSSPRRTAFSWTKAEHRRVAVFYACCVERLGAVCNPGNPRFSREASSNTTSMREKCPDEREILILLALSSGWGTRIRT